MLNQPRVCIVCPDIDPPLLGNSKMAWGLAKRLAKEDVPVHLVTNGSKPEVKKFDSLEILKIPFSSKALLGNVPMINAVRRLLKQYFEKVEIDVIHGHGVFSGFLTALIKEITGKRAVQTINGVWPVYKVKNLVVPMPDFLKFNFMLPFIDLVVCSNNYVKQYLLDAMVPIKSLSVVPYGLEDEWFDCNCKSRPFSEKKEVVFFGDGTNERGLFTLLRAIPKITSKLPETHFTIAIRHWQKSVREHALHLMKSTTTLLEYPHFSNMFELVSSADVVALPFLVNSMEPPLSLIESLAMAKPVVTSDIGGNREIIGDNERGVLIKPNNDTHLANAIIQLLSDEHECVNRGNFARAFITERYDWEKAVNTLTGIYNHVSQQE